MSTRKLKAKTYRKHRADTPYKRPKGVLQTVKDWLTPSKWTNPWEEDEEVEENIEEERQEEEAEGNGNKLPNEEPQHGHCPSPMETGVAGSSRHAQPQESHQLNEALDRDPKGLPHGDNTNIVEKAEELDEVTPIPSLGQKPSNYQQQEGSVMFNGVPGPSSLKRYQQQHQLPPGTTPLLAGAAPLRQPARMFTSTPCISTGGPSNTRHVDTPRPPPATTKMMRQTQAVPYPLPSSSTGRPSFSVSTFHSPTNNLTNLSLSRSPFLSPFYSGRTAYGGMANRKTAHSHKRSRIEASPPTDITTANRPPVRQVIRPRPLSGGGSKPASQTAQKILDTLHSLSSPLHDARKLPLRVTTPAKRMRLEKQSPSASVKSPPPPVASLTAPAPPTVSKVKQPMVIPSSNPPPPTPSLGTKSPITIDLTGQSPSGSGNNVPLSPLRSPLSSSGTGKMKTKRHTSHYRRKDHEEEQPLCSPPSFLSKPVPLTIPSTMTFIPLPGVTTPPQKAVPSAGSSASTQQQGQQQASMFTPRLVQQTTSSISSSPFSFTSPPPVAATSSFSQTTPTSNQNRFEFRPPKPVKESIRAVNRNSSKPSKEVDEKTTESRLPLKTGSVLDALKLPEYQLENIRKESHTRAAGEPSLTSPSSFGKETATQMKPSSNTTTDTVTLASATVTPSLIRLGTLSSCMTETKADSSSKPGTDTRPSLGTGLSLGFGASPKTGVTCAAPKSSEEQKTVTTGTSLPSTSSSSSNWECEDCWASNPPDKANCACCNAPNKKDKQKDSPPQKTTALLVPPSSDKWECPACMLMNEADVMTCPACTEKKPGSTGAASTAAPLVIGREGGLKLGGSLFGTSSSSKDVTPTLKIGNSGGLKLGENLFGNLSSGSGDLTGKGLKIPTLGSASSSSVLVSLANQSTTSSDPPQLIFGSNNTGPSTDTKPGLKIGSGGLKISGPGLKLGGESSVQGVGSGIKLGGDTDLKLSGGSLTTGINLGGNGPSLTGSGMKLGGDNSSLSGSGLKLGEGLKSSAAPELKLGTGTHLKLGEGSGLSGFKLGGDSSGPTLKLGEGTPSLGGIGFGSVGQSTSTAAQPLFKLAATDGFSNTSTSSEPAGGSVRLPMLSPLSSKQSATNPPPLNVGGSFKLPALTPFATSTASGSGIAIPKPNINEKALTGLTFTPPPVVTQQQQTQPPSLSAVPKPSSASSSQPLSITFPPSLSSSSTSGASSFTLTANTFSLPSSSALGSNAGASGNTVGGGSQLPQQQNIFSGSKLSFGQTQAPPPQSGVVAPTPFTGFGSETSSSSIFNPSVSSSFPSFTTKTTPSFMSGPSNTATTAPLGGPNPFSTGIANQSKPLTGFFNQNPPTTQPPAVTATTQGFNFSQFTATPNFSFTAAVPPQQQQFGLQQPSTGGGTPGIFEFGGSSSGTQPVAPPSFQQGRGSSVRGRDIKKARRRLK